MIVKFVHAPTGRIVYATADRAGATPDIRARNGLRSHIIEQLGQPYRASEYRLVTHDDSLPGRQDKAIGH